MASVAQVQEIQSQKSSLHAACVMVGLLVLAAIGWWGCRHSSKQANAPGNKAPGTTEIKAVIHLETFVVNLADPEESRFLRVGIDLGLENPLPSKEGKGEDPRVSTARLRDTILGVLSTWRSDALLAPDGKQKLKQELVHALRERVPNLGVKEVYFTDFLVQR
jgi:flagellar protein FliL